jgi:hypothetical protein
VPSRAVPVNLSACVWMVTVAFETPLEVTPDIHGGPGCRWSTTTPWWLYEGPRI